MAIFGKHKDDEGVYTARPSERRHGHRSSIDHSQSSQPSSPTSASFKRSATLRSKKVSRSDTLLSRPTLTRVPSIQTRYMDMLLHLDEIPRMHNILASISTWIMLAAYLVIPGTFTTLKDSEAFRNAEEDESNEIRHTIVNSVAHIGLLYVSAALCFIGTIGCIFLWWRWRLNYVWLINRIFFPTFFNALAGLLTSVVNIYTAQEGVWSVTARITAIVIGSCAGISGSLFLLYNFVLLERIKKEHEQLLGVDTHEGETFVEKVKRKAHEPPMQPGSVV